MDAIRPEGWPRPAGYSDGIRADAGCRLLFVAGQVGWDEQQRIVPGGFAAQFAQALRNVLAVVTAAGGRPEHLVRMTVYVTDLEAYKRSRGEAGAAWKSLIGRHFPAMALVQVAGLLEHGALVEIEATAALPAAPTLPEPPPTA